MYYYKFLLKIINGTPDVNENSLLNFPVLNKENKKYKLDNDSFQNTISADISEDSMNTKDVFFMPKDKNESILFKLDDNIGTYDARNINKTEENVNNQQCHTYLSLIFVFLLLSITSIISFILGKKVEEQNRVIIISNNDNETQDE